MNFDVLTGHLCCQMKNVRVWEIVMHCAENVCWILMKAQGLRCVHFKGFPAPFNKSLCVMGRHAHRPPVTLQMSNRQSVLKIWLNPSSPCIPPANCSHVIYGIGLPPVRCVCFVGCSAVTMPGL